ncbi:tyrosine-type recombinase/integrase [Streptomyces sp. IMTB 1903]|uniref:tyrosine-type recombinase/integrase n=1 Tax=Streptomyces sp. IMTB 1903 TaxID=1776680 RepID=UPI0007599496|nr:tyrosine-type recombinase/integrase [Streptomyces sp. IMTB 1903]
MTSDSGTVALTGRIINQAGPSEAERIGPDSGTATTQALETLQELRDSGRLGFEELWELAQRWVQTLDSKQTGRAYREAVRQWLAWCQMVRGIDSTRAIFLDASAYNVHMRDAPTVLNRRTGELRPMADSSRKARLGALSSWCGYLMTLDLMEANPFDPRALKRPKVDQDESPTVGLSAAEAAAMMHTARRDRGGQRLRTAALIGFLLTGGPRVSEATLAPLEAYSFHQGHRVIRVLGKGGKHRSIPTGADVERDIDAYLEDRAGREDVDVTELDGLLFPTRTGKPMTQAAVWELVQRIAKAAGVKAFDQISPHSCRHTAITVALDFADMGKVQEMAGHANSRTTKRYDQKKQRVGQSPVYDIARAYQKAAPLDPDEQD